MIFEILYILCCLILIALLSLVLVALVLARKAQAQVSRLFSDDITHLQNKATQLKKKHPQETEAQIQTRVIKGEALNAGIIGFITGLGGILTLPIALPVDIFATIKIQYRLVEYLLNKHQKADALMDTQRMKILAVVFGSSRLSEVGLKFAMKTVTKYAPQVVLKSVPILGGVVGFFIDYYSTKAITKYAVHALTEPVETPAETTSTP